MAPRSIETSWRLYQKRKKWRQRVAAHIIKRQLNDISSINTRSNGMA